MVSNFIICIEKKKQGRGCREGKRKRMRDSNITKRLSIFLKSNNPRQIQSSNQCSYQQPNTSQMDCNQVEITSLDNVP